MEQMTTVGLMPTAEVFANPVRSVGRAVFVVEWEYPLEALAF